MKSIHSSASPMPEKERPTRGQVERTLSQRIQALYRQQLGHLPGKITVSLKGEQITIVIEQAITLPEQRLVDLGQQELTEQVRSELNQVFEQHLNSLIEEIVEVEVVDLLVDTTVETGRTGIIAVLSKKPNFRNPSSSST